MATCKVTYNGRGGQPDKGAIRKAFGEMQQKQPSWQLQMMEGGRRAEVLFTTDKAGVSTHDLCAFIVPYFMYDDFSVSLEG